MFKSLRADKDAYITNKISNTEPAVSGNTGIAGSLDLFKIYGLTLLDSGTIKIPQLELSRLLLHFDLDPLRELISSNKIDVNDSSFNCVLSLRDVYGGQTTPNNFTVDVFPLSASFDEGFGKDVVYFADRDVCNFVSASSAASWYVTGCSQACDSVNQGDYITSSLSIPSTKVSQYFKTGEEDLLVDVTSIISATLMGELPDQGFRISFSESLENDEKTYFVKRFASRHAYDESKRPQLLVRFNDSIEDDNNNFYLDNTSKLFLYNYVSGQPTNIVSASSYLTGNNCVLLELKTLVSGVGDYSLYFTGSQFSIGSNYVSGVYYAEALASLTDSNIKNYFNVSGSVSFTPIWSDLTKTVSILTGSVLAARAPSRGAKRLSPNRYTLSILGAADEYQPEENVILRVNIFDQNDPIIKAKRLPVLIPGVVVRNSYYAIRNSSTNEYKIPFDTTYNSTKLSSDADGMYFSLDTSSLVPGESYAVDIMLLIDGMQHVYKNASQSFRIRKLT